MRTETIHGVSFSYERSGEKEHLTLSNEYGSITLSDLDIVMIFIRRMREIPGDFI